VEVTLYLPYYDYNDDAFDVSNNYYEDGEYIDKMSSEYNNSKDVVYNSILNAQNGTSRLVKGCDEQTYKIGSKPIQSEDKIAFSSSKGVIYNENGDTETVDNLISHFVNKKPFIEMVEFDDATSEEEFISEISLWVKEHNGINKYMDFKGDEWVLENEPKRNIHIRFRNKANEELDGILENCKILDIVDGQTMIIYISKFTLVNKIE